MADTQASQAARSLARARWGNAVVQRAVAVVVERADQLGEAELAELRAVTGREDADE